MPETYADGKRLNHRREAVRMSRDKRAEKIEEREEGNAEKVGGAPL